MEDLETSDANGVGVDVFFNELLVEYEIDFGIGIVRVVTTEEFDDLAEDMFVEEEGASPENDVDAHEGPVDLFYRHTDSIYVILVVFSAVRD